MNQNNVDGALHGFVVSPKYPEFAFGIGDINFKLTPPANHEYRVFAVDVAMTQEYSLNSFSILWYSLPILILNFILFSSCLQNVFAIDSTVVFCQGDPINLLIASSETILIRYKSPLQNEIDTSVQQISDLRGFKLYFQGSKQNSKNS